MTPMVPGTGAAAWVGGDGGAGGAAGDITVAPWAVVGARAGALAEGFGACTAGANTVGGIWVELALLAGDRAGIPAADPDAEPDTEPDAEPAEGVASTSDSAP